jgi:hypothetical protein
MSGHPDKRDKSLLEKSFAKTNEYIFRETRRQANAFGVKKRSKLPAKALKMYQEPVSFGLTGSAGRLMLMNI